MNVLFLDDEDYLFGLVKRYFSMMGVDNVYCSSSPDEAFLEISRKKYDYFFIDYNIPDMGDINKYVSKIDAGISVVIVSGDDRKYVENNINFKYIFLKKPFVLDDIKNVINLNNTEG